MSVDLALQKMGQIDLGDLDLLLRSNTGEEPRSNRESYITSLVLNSGVRDVDARIALGLHMLGDSETREWGSLDQSLADIHDSIADTFGKVKGFVFDKFFGGAVILNTDVAADEEMKIITLTPTSDTSLIMGQIDETREVFSRGTLLEMCGSLKKESTFINAIDRRFRLVRKRLTATKASHGNLY